MKKRSIVTIALFILIVLPSVYGADVKVPTIELITRGYPTSTGFALASYGTFDLLVDGGFKFGGSLMFGFANDHLESLLDQSSAPAPVVLDPEDTEAEHIDTLVEALNLALNLQKSGLYFKSASLVARSLFGLPLDIAYFVGQYDPFCEGSDFVKVFGAESFTTGYSGYMYFPEGIPGLSNTRYYGIHKAAGTGIAVTLNNELIETMATSLYFYQDGYLGAGTYSADLRYTLNLQNLKLEAFVGSTFPQSVGGLYRTGLLFFFDTGFGGEFFAQVGVPRFDPFTETFSINHLYFLFEPRVRFDLLSIITTLFWHPMYYLLQETEETGALDINANVKIGDIDAQGLTGGAEANLKLRSTGSELIAFTASPYLSFVTRGVVWNIKANVKLWPFDIANLVEVYIGLKSEF